jgi:hypothetical protein
MIHFLGPKSHVLTVSWVQLMDAMQFFVMETRHAGLLLPIWQPAEKSRVMVIVLATHLIFM